MSWKAGDMAIVVADGNYDPKDEWIVGSTCQLVEHLGRQHWKSEGMMSSCWRVAISERDAWVSEPCLRKPYNGHSKCSWESMKDIWTPDVIATPVSDRI